MTTFTRRTFLKGALAALTSGLIPSIVSAAWPKAAFQQKTLDDAIREALGPGNITEAEDLVIKAPDIAENGAVVPVTIKTDRTDVETIAILATGNNQPLVGTFVLGAGAIADVSARIKMAKTSDIVAVARVGDQLYRNHKNVKVTIGGCGG
ncbi:MAG: thiosulfate oxidation carrier protein SoxY [Pseudomonadota bacterium]